MVEQQNGSTYTQMLYSQAGKTAIMNGQTLKKAFVYLPGGATAIYNSSGLAPVEYSPLGKAVVADAALLREMANHAMRELMRETGLSQHTLEAIRQFRPVRPRTLAILKQALRSV